MAYSLRRATLGWNWWRWRRPVGGLMPRPMNAAQEGPMHQAPDLLRRHPLSLAVLLMFAFSSLFRHRRKAGVRAPALSR
jgi:hypothetical protein